MVLSFGVGCFGRALETGPPVRRSGFLLLLPDRLFFRNRSGRIELDIPGGRIARVYHDRTHKGVDLNQSVIKLDFLTETGQEDAVAFRVPYPPQWIRAIGTTLLKANCQPASATQNRLSQKKDAPGSFRARPYRIKLRG